MISGEKFAAGPGFDFAVYRHLSFTDKVLRLASRIGKTGCFDCLGQRNVFSAQGKGRHGRDSSRCLGIVERHTGIFLYRGSCRRQARSQSHRDRHESESDKV